MPHPPYADKLQPVFVKDASLEYLHEQLTGGRRHFPSNEPRHREAVMQRDETPNRYTHRTHSVQPDGRYGSSADTHFVPMRHSLKSSERFRTIPGAAAPRALTGRAAKSPTRTNTAFESSTASSASAPPGRTAAVSPHGVRLSGCASLSSVSDRSKSPVPLAAGLGRCVAGYPASLSPLRSDGTVSTPVTPMTSPMTRSRMCPPPCSTTSPFIQRPAPVSPRAVEKLLSVPTPLNGIRYASSQEKPNFSRPTTPQARTQQPRVLRTNSGCDLDTPNSYSRSPSQARPRASPTAPRFLSLGAIATAAEALEKARQLQTAVEPPKQIPHQTHQVYQAQRAAPPSPIPLGVTGSTPPREPAFRMTQPLIKVCVEPPPASTATPGSARSLDRSTPEETAAPEVKPLDAFASDEVGKVLSDISEQVQHLQDAGTSDPKEWWQVIAETRAWRRNQRARQGWSQDIMED